MSKTLASRVGRIEMHTRSVWRAQRQTRCPWEWSMRLAAYRPRYNEIVDVGLPIAQARQWILMRPEPPRMHAGTLFTLLAEHSRMALFVKRLDDWNPTDVEWRSMELFTELAKLGHEYLAASDDPAPWSTHWWKDPRLEGRSLRGRGPQRMRW